MKLVIYCHHLFNIYYCDAMLVAKQHERRHGDTVLVAKQHERRHGDIVRSEGYARRPFV
jgi:hypothetical protein